MPDSPRTSYQCAIFQNRGKIDGVFYFNPRKKYKEFYELYLEKCHLRKTMPEKYGDIAPGNYIFALLGLYNYDKVVHVCLEEIKREQDESIKNDMSSSDFFIGLSIAYFKLGKFDEEVHTIRNATKAIYQDIPRTQAACIMYYEAVVSDWH